MTIVRYFDWQEFKIDREVISLNSKKLRFDYEFSKISHPLPTLWPPNTHTLSLFAPPPLKKSLATKLHSDLPRRIHRITMRY